MTMTAVTVPVKLLTQFSLFITLCDWHEGANAINLHSS